MKSNSGNIIMTTAAPMNSSTPIKRTLAQTEDTKTPSVMLFPNLLGNISEFSIKNLFTVAILNGNPDITGLAFEILLGLAYEIL